MEYKSINIDFVARTKEIVAARDDFFKEYDVTLLLNCMLGLLIIPQQKLYQKSYLTNKPLTSEWGIQSSQILFMTDKKGTEEPKDIKNIIRHLRNSLSHFNFDAHGDGEKIIEIRFKDYDAKTKIQTFDAIIPVENLSVFTKKLSDFYLKIEEK